MAAMDGSGGVRGRGRPRKRVVSDSGDDGVLVVEGLGGESASSVVASSVDVRLVRAPMPGVGEHGAWVQRELLDLEELDKRAEAAWGLTGGDLLSLQKLVGIRIAIGERRARLLGLDARDAGGGGQTPPEIRQVALTEGDVELLRRS